MSSRAVAWKLGNPEKAEKYDIASVRSPDEIIRAPDIECVLNLTVPAEVNMYNTILVPLDSSKRAEAILPHVENLATKYKAKVIFMKVIDLPPVNIAHSRKTFEQHREELKVLEKQDGEYLAEIQRIFREKGIDAATHLTQGPVVEEIIATAERESADLIAIASHGRGGLSRAFYGSVSAALLQRIDRPLLLVRSRKIQVQ